MLIASYHKAGDRLGDCSIEQQQLFPAFSKEMTSWKGPKLVFMKADMQ